MKSNSRKIIDLARSNSAIYGRSTKRKWQYLSVCLCWDLGFDRVLLNVIGGDQYGILYFDNILASPMFEPRRRSLLIKWTYLVAIHACDLNSTIEFNMLIEWLNCWTIFTIEYILWTWRVCVVKRKAIKQLPWARSDLDLALGGLSASTASGKVAHWQEELYIW